MTEDAIDTMPGIQPTLNELISLRQYARHMPYQAKAKAHHSLSGVRLAQPLGRGLEFDQVRMYNPGDDVTSMDWKVTARTNKPHIKEYRQERERPVIVVVDQRASMHFGTKTAFKSYIAAKMAALTTWLAIDNGERVGACVWTNNGVERLPIKTGAQNALRLFQILSDLPIAQCYQPSLSFNDGLQQLQPMVQNRCLIVLLSDFAGIDEQSVNVLTRLRPHAQIVAGFIYDNAEKNPPPAAYYPITDGSEQATVINLFDKKQIKRYQQQFVKHFQRVQKLCRHCQIPLHSMATDQDCFASPLMHWLCRMS